VASRIIGNYGIRILIDFKELTKLGWIQTQFAAQPNTEQDMLILWSLNRAKGKNKRSCIACFSYLPFCALHSHR